MSFKFGPVTNSFIEGIIFELRKTETRDKILDNILSPLFGDIYIRYYYYFMIFNIILILIVILLIYVVVTIRKNRNLILLQKNK